MTEHVTHYMPRRVVIEVWVDGRLDHLVIRELTWWERLWVWVARWLDITPN